MKKLSLLLLGLILIGSAAGWRYWLAVRWTQRVPPGWNSESKYIGTNTYPDPKTGKIPEKDITCTYEHNVKIAAEGPRRKSVVLEDTYGIRDLATRKVVYEYISRAPVDPLTGAHIQKEHAGEYFLFPRNVDKKTYVVRCAYLKGIPLSFQREEVVEGLATYVFGYKGRAEYTDAYQGTADFPGIKVEPGQEIRCADDQFTYSVWVEPVTGEIIRTEEGCPSADYAYDIATGKKLYPIDRWGGETAGDDVIARVELVGRERSKYLWIALYFPGLLLGAGLVCLAMGAITKNRPGRHSGQS